MSLKETELSPSISKADSGPSVLKAAGAMGFATLMSRVLGLVREQVFAYFFGAGNFTDAFNIAFRIPNLFRDLFAEGAMSASLVPTFTQTREKEGERRAWRIAGLVFRCLFVFVALLSLLGIVFAPALVNLYASAFKQIPGKFEITVLMTRIMFPFFPLVALAAAFMGVLNASGAFFLPAFSSALFNLTSVGVGLAGVGLVSYFRWEFQPIIAMAIGVVAGGAVQAFVQLPLLRKKGYRWIPRAESDPEWQKEPRLKQILGMMLPGMVGLAATQVSLLVNTVLATSQGPGAVSWLNYAFRLMQFPIGVFGVSVASATLSRISAQWARNEVDQAEVTLIRSMKTVFAINLPASVGLAVLGIPIIELIFQYGRLYAEDAHAIALALVMYSIGLTAYSSVKVLVPASYAFGNTRLPVISSILSVVITISLNLIMIRPFGYWGLALGTSLAAIFNAIFLLFSIQKLIREKGGQFKASHLLGPFCKYLAVAGGMGALVWITHWGLLIGLPNSLFSELMGSFGILVARLIRVSIVVFEGAAILLIAGKIFRLNEILEIIEIFEKRVKNKVRLKRT
ncbi:MAG: murein biosynthesis integral membrane protein MurJ [Bdellovibrio sp.]|nr:murein biosynthesis integral membrane protein MurJ [Bdellovibrio sp.]